MPMKPHIKEGPATREERLDAVLKYAYYKGFKYNASKTWDERHLWRTVHTNMRPTELMTIVAESKTCWGAIGKVKERVQLAIKANDEQINTAGEGFW